MIDRRVDTEQAKTDVGCRFNCTRLSDTAKISNKELVDLVTAWHAPESCEGLIKLGISPVGYIKQVNARLISVRWVFHGFIPDSQDQLNSFWVKIALDSTTYVKYRGTVRTPSSVTKERKVVENQYDVLAFFGQVLTTFFKLGLVRLRKVLLAKSIRYCSLSKDIWAALKAAFKLVWRTLYFPLTSCAARRVCESYDESTSHYTLGGWSVGRLSLRTTLTTWSLDIEWIIDNIEGEYSMTYSTSVLDICCGIQVNCNPGGLLTSHFITYRLYAWSSI